MDIKVRKSSPLRTYGQTTRSKGRCRAEQGDLLDQEDSARLAHMLLNPPSLSEKFISRIGHVKDYLASKPRAGT